MSIDSEALDAATLAAISTELKTDLSPANAPLLNDPATTVKLVNANAVIGLVAKDSNATLGRAPTGLTPTSTEAEVDAYLSNKAYYPVGMFDDTPDGNGDPMHNSALFRQDLAAPFGTDGSIVALDNFGNLVYTALLDPTDLTTPGGRAFLEKLGGKAAGDEIVDGYIQVLAATGVTGYPYAITAKLNVAPGTEMAPLGLRVDNQKLIDMNAYLASLQPPRAY